jgi:sortase A
MVFTTSSKKEINLSKYFIIAGLVLFLTGFLIFVLTFFPIFKEEAKFAFRKTNPTNSLPIQPIDTNFGIVIPKIVANAKVIDNVDPYNIKDYQYALTKGVAHAIGTAYPGNAGNIFIFAHSSANWFTANQYNSVFYLVNKLETGDKIEMYFKGKKYEYEVTEKKYVEADEIQYLNNNSGANTSILTLMTCWPPGTTLKRLIIRAKIIN